MDFLADAKSADTELDKLVLVVVVEGTAATGAKDKAGAAVTLAAGAVKVVEVIAEGKTTLFTGVIVADPATAGEGPVL